jgi:ribosome biogenesis SPOUT family RNA methylase Rps3
VPLEKIEYVDYPEIIVNKHERTEMPFRYVKGDDGQPIMPAVCLLVLSLKCTETLTCTGYG